MCYVGGPDLIERQHKNIWRSKNNPSQKVTFLLCHGLQNNWCSVSVGMVCTHKNIQSKGKQGGKWQCKWKQPKFSRRAGFWRSNVMMVQGKSTLQEGMPTENSHIWEANLVHFWIKTDIVISHTAIRNQDGTRQQSQHMTTMQFKYNYNTCVCEREGVQF